MKWPEDGCHTMRFEHQLRTDLVKGTGDLSFVSALLREGREGKTRKVLLIPIAVDCSVL